MTAKLRVLIADDHPLTRVGIRLALERGGFDVCAEADDGPSAVEAAERERPDVCLLDVQMPGSGIQAAEGIATRVPEAAIVMLTVSRRDSDLFDALRAGASGYLLKDTDPQRLPLALQGVLDGEAALPRHLVALVIDEFRERGRRRPLLKRRGVVLTDREWEVLELMSQGMTTFEIADRLFIEPVTVRTHVSAILKKLHVSSRKAALQLLER
ncbi:MAG TPA: response regulator transcription factor [Gaiellaceae bacterium]|nr:response regulator transcription factor [Gaiellaceae bacterium]